MNKLLKLSMVTALTLGLVACAKTEGSEEKGIKIAVNSNKRGDYTSALVNKYFSQFPWTAVYGERERVWRT